MRAITWWRFWCLGRGNGHATKAPFYMLAPRAKCDCGAPYTTYGERV